MLDRPSAIKINKRNLRIMNFIENAAESIDVALSRVFGDGQVRQVSALLIAIDSW